MTAFGSTVFKFLEMLEQQALVRQDNLLGESFLEEAIKLNLALLTTLVELNDPVYFFY